MNSISAAVITAVFAMSYSGVAHADVWSDCQAAIATGNRDKAKQLAKDILRLNITFDVEKRLTGLACLNFVMDEPYIYDLVEDALMTEAKSAELAQERAERAQEREELAERRRQDRQKIAETAARDAEFEQLRREQVATKKRAVWLRVAEACQALYKKHPDETITNKICFETFLVTGLPDGQDVLSANRFLSNSLTIGKAASIFSPSDGSGSCANTLL